MLLEWVNTREVCEGSHGRIYSKKRRHVVYIGPTPELRKEGLIYVRYIPVVVFMAQSPERYNIEAG